MAELDTGSSATTGTTEAGENAATESPVQEGKPGNTVAADSEESTGQTPTESDFLSDDEWKKLANKKRRMKIDDAEVDMTLAEIEKNTGLNKSITTKAQLNAKEKAELASEKGKIAAFFQRLKEDPEAYFEFAKALGHDPDELAIKRAYQRMEYERKTPEQKEAIAAQQRAEAAEARLAEIEERENATQAQQDEQAVFDETKADIDSALEALGGEVNYLNIDRIAQIYQALNSKNGKKPSPQEVAAIVRRNFDQDIEGYLSTADVKTLASRLPKTKLQELKRHLLEMEQPRLPHGSSQMGSNPEASKANKRKEVGLDDWFKSL